METILLGALASLIAAGTIYAAKRGITYVRRRRIPLTLGKLALKSPTFASGPLPPDRVIKYLIRFLASDQSRDGHHLGQFGVTHNLRKEEEYTGARENVVLKPRMFLTLWPCIILKKLDLGRSQLAFAQKGVSQLLHYGGGLVHVNQGAAGGPMRPDVTHVTVVSHRHTICAARILLLLEGLEPYVHATLGRMLDPQQEWQNADGGWKQLAGSPDSDLWASVYAVRLLTDSQPMATNRDPKLLNVVVDSTLVYLKTSWRNSQWAYGKVSAAENGLWAVIELAPLIKDRDIAWFKQIRDWTLQWLTPVGTISDSFMHATTGVSTTSANARIAYALFRLGGPTEVWLPLYTAAVESFDRAIIAPDAAFLLHLAREIKRTLNHTGGDPHRHVESDR